MGAVGGGPARVPHPRPGRVHERVRAVFDLAWPNGIQEELSQPVAVLLNEDNETVAIASQAGFRCFTETSEFRRYVSEEIVAADPKL